MRDGWLCDLGRMPYRQAYTVQTAVNAAQIEGRIGEGLLLVEHPPVITVGRRSRPEDLFTSPEQLTALGIEVIETDRGGQLTYHGPGQIVAYPLIHLTTSGLKLDTFLRALEEAVIRTLSAYGVDAGRVAGKTGVWVGDEKICAIGLRIRRWWSFHGLAFNVGTSLDPFRLFIPCGIADRGVTSLHRLLGRSVPMDEVKALLTQQLGDQLGCAWRRSYDPAELLVCIEPSSPPPSSPPPSAASPPTAAEGFSQRQLARVLEKVWPELPALHFDSLDSTLEEARRRLDAGALPPFFLLAEHQTAGRGRRGNAWLAPPGSSLLMTLTLPFPVHPGAEAHMPLMPLIAGLAVAEGLEPFLPQPPRLKWPNDVVVEGRKLCGILAEGWKPGTPGAALMIGIGINVAQEGTELPEGADYAVTSLLLERRCGAMDPENPGRDAVLEEVLARLRRYLSTPPMDLLARLENRCATLGRAVMLRQETGEVLVGTAIALGPDGALHIRLENGKIVRCLSGQVRELPAS